MLTLRVICEETGKDVEKIKRFYELDKKIMQNESCIKSLQLINEQGEIIDECKKPIEKNSNTTENQKAHLM